MNYFFLFTCDSLVSSASSITLQRHTVEWYKNLTIFSCHSFFRIIDALIRKPWPRNGITLETKCLINSWNKKKRVSGFVWKLGYVDKILIHSNKFSVLLTIKPMCFTSHRFMFNYSTLKCLIIQNKKFYFSDTRPLKSKFYNRKTELKNVWKGSARYETHIKEIWPITQSPSHQYYIAQSKNFSYFLCKIQIYIALSVY